MSPTHWLIVIAVAVLLFGPQRPPEAACPLGRPTHILRSELRAWHEPEPPIPPATDNPGARE